MAKILIVDDSNFIKTIMKSILAEGGYTDVIEAENGKEAIQKTVSESPDLVLLDIVMGDMDGLEVLKQIGTKTKVCMVTAIGQDDTVKKATEMGAVGYIMKPFEKKNILETVKKLLV